MNEEAKRLRDDPSAREELRERLDRYLDVPLTLASLALVLLAVIELTGEARRFRLGALGVVLRRVRGQVRARARKAPLPALALAGRPDRAPAVPQGLAAGAGSAGEPGATDLPAAGLRGEGLAVYPGAPQAPPARPARHHLRDGDARRLGPGVPPRGRGAGEPDRGLRGRPLVVGGPRHHDRQRALPRDGRRTHPGVLAHGLRHRHLHVLHRLLRLRAGSLRRQPNAEAGR